MDFFVNGQKIDVTIEDEKTVGDVLRSFESSCEENDAAVIGISVNGEKITADKFDSTAARPLTAETSFSFDVVTRQTISESFVKLSSLFTELAEKMEQIPAELQSGKDNEARTAITALADDIDTFCHTATLASLFPDSFKTILIDGKPFQQFFSDFSPVLSDFENALKSDDTVQIGDLAEYEISPRLRSIAASLGGIS